MAHRDEDKRLHFLHDLKDYKVASEHPDVRGWKLVDAEYEAIGTVENLLVDVKKEKVRYLDVALNEAIISGDYDALDNSDVKGVHGFTNRQGEDHLIVPIGLARLNRDEKCVVVADVKKSTFQQVPRYNAAVPIGADYEYAVSQALASPQAGMNNNDRPVGTATPDEFYEDDSFDEERFYSNRRSKV